MKLIIIDDNKPFRDSLRFYLERTLEHEVIAEAIDGIEFLRIENSNEADAILMDVEMPNINGIQAVQIALSHNPKLNVIAVTSFYDKMYLLDLLNVGFKACVFKNRVFEELEKALYEISNQRKYFPENIKIIDKKKKPTNNI